MTPLEVLRATKERLSSPRRWRKGGGTTGGRACLVNSIPGEGKVLWMRVTPLLRAVLPVGFDDLGCFNDAPHTTYRDIIALLDRAIALAEEE